MVIMLERRKVEQKMKQYLIIYLEMSMAIKPQEPEAPKDKTLLLCEVLNI